MDIRFASWNIGGGILGESHQEGGKANLGYYVNFLREYKPDIVCLLLILSCYVHYLLSISAITSPPEMS
jgi:hypothetical protein